MNLNWELIAKELHFTAVRSRGPGGQNVNRTSSAAKVTWAFGDSAALSPAQKNRIRIKLANIINSYGEIYLRAEEFRDLERNRARVLSKLKDLIAEALYVQPPRFKTKPTRAAKAKRVDKKSQRGQTKKLRQKVDY